MSAGHARDAPFYGAFSRCCSGGRRALCARRARDPRHRLTRRLQPARKRIQHTQHPVSTASIRPGIARPTDGGRLSLIDVTVSNRRELTGSFPHAPGRAAFLTKGVTPRLRAPATCLGANYGARRSDVTVALVRRLFDDRYGLASRKPPSSDMRSFAHDDLGPDDHPTEICWCTVAQPPRHRR